MKLERLTERIWIYPYEEERDRPNLSYIRGDRWSLAVDAGHSADHTREFYKALEEAGLPLPELTVITHWHWDHTFGMHVANGLSIANEKTNSHLAEWKNKIEKNGPAEFFALHESIRKEYSENKEVIVKLADIVYSGEMALDLGGCTVKVVQSQAPHTDDSTLVYIENDKTLFLGDATCKDFTIGKKDPALCKKLADTIRNLNPQTCVEGHWVPVETDDTLNDLLSGV